MPKPQSRPSHLQLVTSPPAETPPATPPWRNRSALLAACALAVALAGGYARLHGGPDDPDESSADASLENSGDSEASMAMRASSADSAMLAPHAEVPLAFDVFVHSAATPRMPRRLNLDDTAHVGDGYTFVIYNRAAVPTWFMLFGIDAQQTFYWFYPESDTAKAKTSIPLAAVPVSQLPEGVTPANPAGALQIVGVFTHRAVTMAEVEQAYAQGGVDALRSGLQAIVQVHTLDVTGDIADIAKR